MCQCSQHIDQQTNRSVWYSRLNILCCTLCCVPCWHVICNLASRGEAFTGAKSSSWCSTPWGYIKLLLCTKRTEYSRRQKKDGGKYNLGGTKKVKQDPKEEVPSTSIDPEVVKGQIIVESAEVETGQMKCCNHWTRYALVFWDFNVQYKSAGNEANVCQDSIRSLSETI